MSILRQTLEFASAESCVLTKCVILRRAESVWRRPTIGSVIGVVQIAGCHWRQLWAASAFLARSHWRARAPASGTQSANKSFLTGAAAHE